MSGRLSTRPRWLLIIRKLLFQACLRFPDYNRLLCGRALDNSKWPTQHQTFQLACQCYGQTQKVLGRRRLQNSCGTGRIDMTICMLLGRTKIIRYRACSKDSTKEPCLPFIGSASEVSPLWYRQWVTGVPDLAKCFYG